MGKRIPYKRKELYGGDGTRLFTGQHLTEIAFPLGGIGAGCVSLGGWGQLRDWEIFNHPNKGCNSSTSFFALRAQQGHGKPEVRLLQGQPRGSYATGGHGLTQWNVKLPAFRKCEFEGAFPFAQVHLQDNAIPVDVTLQAFNPFIPLDAKNSSLPVAVFRFHLHHRGTDTVKLRLYALLENLAGFPETGMCHNEVRETSSLRGVHLTTKKHAAGSPRSGSMAVVTPHAPGAATAKAILSTAFDGAWEFWESLNADGKLPHAVDVAESGEKGTLTCGLALDAQLEPGEDLELPVILAWHSPVSDAGGKPWKTYVHTLFADAWEAAEYALTNLDQLTARTRAFAERLHHSTLPGIVVEAVSSQLSILKSPTCLRFADGGFWGWEGCSERGGCCLGTCSHVWNYAQALPYLFPDLQRSVREQHFRLNMDENGRMCFRQPLPPETKANVQGFHPAADGQLGGVMKVYREWLISGDDEWLSRVWPDCRKSLEYAWTSWDADKNGVMEGVQHNTYDNEFWGPNTMLGTFYLGALKAGAAMARHLGETERAQEYERVFESGRAWVEENLFTGWWYRQIINAEAGPSSAHPSSHLREGETIPRYQYGEGCLSDQLIGQWYATMLGLGDLLDPTHVRITLKSIFRHNWRFDLSDHACLLRAYALAREAGLLICTWPKVEQPPYPFWFSSEVWCGIEYQVASHMVYEGLLNEALSIVKGVRDRHTGMRRNPYDEFECGHHYSRSLASYGLLLAFSGFQYDGPQRRIGFAPQVHQENFGCFFAVDGAWGGFEQTKARDTTVATIVLDEGALPLRSVVLPDEPADCSLEVWLGAQAVEATAAEAKDARGEAGLLIALAEEQTVAPGTPLRIRLT